MLSKNLLIIIVVGVLIGLGGVFLHKLVKIKPQPQETHSVLTEPVVNPEILALRAEVDKLRTEYRQELDKLWAKNKFNSDRLTVLGVVANENGVIIQQNYPKDDLIFLNSDWTMERAPKYLKISSDNDREFLKRWVKPQNTQYQTFPTDE